MTRKSHTSEKQILAGCLDVLTKLECCKATFLPPGDKDLHDGLIRLAGPMGSTSYLVEVKRGLTGRSANILINQIHSRRQPDKPVLLCLDHVHQNLVETLRDHQIEFVDPAGNIYLHRPWLYVLVTGRKRAQRRERPTRAFQTTGLKLVYLLLKEPRASEWNYRVLAETAGISLGNVGWVLRDLRAAGYLRLAGKRRRELVNGIDLLHRWEIAYGETLRPKLFRNNYRLAGGKTLTDLANSIRTSDQIDTVLLGGELGASLLIARLRPERATLHLLGETRKITTALRLIPDDVGPIDVLEAFGTANYYTGDLVDGCRVADPLLMHAELLLHPSERLREIANDIYETYLLRRLVKDDQS
jgi:hypothetical protein